MKRNTKSAFVWFRIVTLLSFLVAVMYAISYLKSNSFQSDGNNPLNSLFGRGTSSDAEKPTRADNTADGYTATVIIEPKEKKIPTESKAPESPGSSDRR